jgi:hypothetical protein
MARRKSWCGGGTMVRLPPESPARGATQEEGFPEPFVSSSALFPSSDPTPTSDISLGFLSNSPLNCFLAFFSVSCYRNYLYELQIEGFSLMLYPCIPVPFV